MLNSAKHEIFSVNKYVNANKLAFLYLFAEKVSCSVMFCKKELAIVNNLGFINKENFVSAEHGKNPF